MSDNAVKPTKQSSNHTPDETDHAPNKRINWPLITGGLLVGIVLILAILGPTIAPRDPREHNLIIQVEGEWMTPPYPAFTPGFPLGSDNLGRDLYSWLLWSVRPTIILVIVVALLRMALGVVIGVIAGWSDQWGGRIADALISSALAIPALIAALIVITALGFRLGVWAFIVGLSVTGWAETAQLVRERTRTVKSQQAVEAAQALGASGAQIFLLHILPQVMPMVWMLLAFEVSSTLVTSAGLGFLGYYLGGAVFTEVDDFVYQRISEMPELGQMLATAWLVLDEPWAMVAAGTVVFLIVLAFNLVGEGLQSRLTRKLGGARKIYLHLAGGLTPWLDEHLVVPVTTAFKRPALRATVLVMTVVLLGGAVWLRLQNPADETLPGQAASATATAAPATTAAGGETDPEDTPEPTTATVSPVLAVPGGHIWANETRDPWRSQWVDFTGPLTNTEQWTFDIDGSFTGGPVIDTEGILYIAGRPTADDSGDTESAPGALYALDASGTPQWETPLEGRPVGSPALAADGTLYVAEKEGVSAVSPQGELQWHFTPDEEDPAMDGPIVGPDGTIYYKSLGGLVALTPNGERRWQAPITRTMTAKIPHLSASGDVVYWENFAFRTDNGMPYTNGMPSMVRGYPLVQIVTGADGETYYQYDVILTKEIDFDGAEASDEPPAPPLIFDWSPHTWQGTDAGITPGGRPWLQARPAVGGMGLGFYWGTPEGEQNNRLSEVNMRDAQVLSVDAHDTAYICMDGYRVEPRCVAFGTETNSALWRVNFRGIEALAGAALGPGRLYVATWDGTLTAIGEDREEDAAALNEGETAPVSDPFPEALTFGPEPVWEEPVIPGNHLWPMPGRDAWATHWTPARGPDQATRRWVFEAPEGAFTGGPVIAADGTLYIGTNAGKVWAVTPDGQVAWQVALKGAAIGSPAIGPDGTIYATDGQAYLSAISPNGKIQWQYHATGVITETRHAQSGDVIRETPIPLDALGPAGAGPIVAPNGTIYYSMAVEVQRHEANVFFRSEVRLAVTPDGRDAELPVFAWSQREPPRLSIDGHWMIWSDAFMVPTAEIDDPGTQASPYYDYLSAKVEEAQQEGGDLSLRVVNGADGRAYFLAGRTLTPWYLTQTMVELGRTASWNAETIPDTAIDAGATPNGQRWITFRNGYFTWIAEDGESLESVRFPLESGLIGLDGDNAVYGCGSSLGRAPECMKFVMGDEEPVWSITLNEDESFIGGALAPQVLYAATDSGRLYALSAPD